MSAIVARTVRVPRRTKRSLRGLAAAREELGPSAFDAAWSAGKSMELAEMIRKGSSIANLPA